jgi:hypothetical protein
MEMTNSNADDVRCGMVIPKRVVCNNNSDSNYIIITIVTIAIATVIVIVIITITVIILIIMLAKTIAAVHHIAHSDHRVERAAIGVTEVIYE